MARRQSGRWLATLLAIFVLASIAHRTARAQAAPADPGAAAMDPNAGGPPPPPDGGPGAPPPPPDGGPGRGPDGGPGRGPDGGPGAPPNPRTDRLSQIAMTMDEDDFVALKPKFNNILDDLADLQISQGGRDGRGGRGPDGRGPDGRGPDGRGPGGPPDPNAPDAAAPSELSVAYTNLISELYTPDATPDSIKAKVDAYHAALSKAQEKLVKDRADLQSVLTQKQEAEMIVMGILQ